MILSFELPIELCFCLGKPLTHITLLMKWQFIQIYVKALTKKLCLMEEATRTRIKSKLFWKGVDFDWFTV